LNNNHQALIDYEKLCKSALLAIPTPEHYLPLIYTLGLTTIKDKPTLFNDKAIGGSLTMTSVKYC
jgi:4,5-DOPA dioxygenase extradiol